MRFFKLLWVLLLFPSVLCSQDKTDMGSVLKSDLTNQEKIDKIDSLLVNLEAKQYDSLGYLYHDYAYWLYGKNDINEVIYLEEKR